jgi:outer membrane PBP1 activator LpoA protein
MMSAIRRARNGASALRVALSIAAVVALIAGCASAPQQDSDTAQAGRSATVAAPRSKTKPAPVQARPHFPVPVLPARQPTQIALLLPVSGRLAGFGSAIRDGFMAALFDARTRDQAVPAVRIYDTNTGGAFIDIYRRAIAEGAQAVVGPLEKPQVAALFSQALPVPTLALNRTDMNSAPPANLYQFGLAPEDEAVSIAHYGQTAGYRRALIVTPAGDQSSSEVLAFKRAWQEQGSSIVATAVFQSPQTLSSAVKSALDIPQSELRKREVEGIVGGTVEFAPHRRDDIDMVLVIGRPQQARSILPTLAFHYAGDIPAFALSRSFSGINAPQLDDDIEGLHFTEIPWMLNAQQPLRQLIAANIAGSQSYLRLYALGVDSFTLLAQLPELAGHTGMRIDGQTGALTLSPQRIVLRELPFAQIRNGVASRLDNAPVHALPASSGSGGGMESPTDATLDAR